ncbi:MAG: LysM peptidoglycan-binding domain-containing protein [Ectothiorhodospiraceae bacterium]|nr:LysM peptidoglycan-binding domain-containing protein [Chromatiales bacterium]MCP5156357.1 LysM peptidoglycan-binding domain-containing protein [Ectothiorhodospiraceae bacterium]
MTTEYVVKSGDTLSRIAERLLGSAGKWSVIAEVNRLTNPDRLRVGQKLLIPSTEPVVVPAVVHPVPPPSGTQTVTFSVEGRDVFALDATSGQRIHLGRTFRKGLSRHGLLQPEAFIAARPGDLEAASLSRSEVAVMLATAENEGNLDAINTWDDAFLSFGMFQWTAGTGAERGELAALLAVLEREFPDVFAHYLGRFGLGVAGSDGTTGFLSLDGQRLDTPERKERLRDLAWVLRFVQAAADLHVRTVQVRHAVARLDGFYFRAQSRLGGHALAELLTSELGAALLLDHHVNRPGHVVGTVAQALEELGVTADRLAAGDDALEARAIDRYLAVRETFGRHPMTHAARRGAVTRDYVARGVISAARGTFVSNRALRQG